MFQKIIQILSSAWNSLSVRARNRWERRKGKTKEIPKEQMEQEPSEEMKEEPITEPKDEFEDEEYIEKDIDNEEEFEEFDKGK